MPNNHIIKETLKKDSIKHKSTQKKLAAIVTYMYVTYLYVCYLYVTYIVTYISAFPDLSCAYPLNKGSNNVLSKKNVHSTRLAQCISFFLLDFYLFLFYLQDREGVWETDKEIIQPMLILQILVTASAEPGRTQEPATQSGPSTRAQS